MLCTASSDAPTPEINLHKIMEEISSGRGGRWTQKAVDTAVFNEVSVSLEKNEIREVCEILYIPHLKNNSHLDGI